MGEMSKISVIIPTYNRAHYLPQSLRAILNQSRKVDQIIVVDDGSSDSTSDVVGKFMPNVTYLYQQNSGKAAALNRGLEICTGDYIWICDDDDVAEPSAAELLGGTLDRSANAAFAFGKFRRFTEDLSTGSISIFDCGYWPDLDKKPILIALLQDFFIFQNATFVRKTAYEVVGKFRTDLIRSQDYEMIIRLAIAFPGIYVREYIFLQRDHEGMRGSSADRFSASQQFERWSKYDAIFFRELIPNISLDILVPQFIKDKSVRQRAAILQRAAIYARKKIWDRALIDLKLALTLNRLPLTNFEVGICSDFLLSKYGCDELATDRSISLGLKSLRKHGELGKSVTTSISRALLWRITEALESGRISIALKFLRAYLDINGLMGLCSVICRKPASPMGRSAVL